MSSDVSIYFFFFNDTAPTEIYTLSLHDALPISPAASGHLAKSGIERPSRTYKGAQAGGRVLLSRDEARFPMAPPAPPGDRKSTRLNSSHANISYAVFCLEKKNKCTSRSTR